MNTSPATLVWEKIFGGRGDSRAYDMIPCGDGGFLAVGSSSLIINGNKTLAWIVRVDSDGNMLWNKTYDTKDMSEIRKAEKLVDGFLLVGNLLDSNDSWGRGWILRIDDSGDVLWNKTLSESGTSKLFSASTAADGYVMAGFTYPVGDINSSAWLIKTDSDGNILWSKTFGGPGNSGFRSIVVTADNEYVIAGYTNSIGHGNYDSWLVKTNQDGDVVWNQTYGGPEDDFAYALTATNGGYVLAGETHSFGVGEAAAFVVKTDLNGNLVWEKAYGGTGYDVANAVIQSSSGGYVLVGSTTSYGAGNRDFWTFKIDDNGNILWGHSWGTPAFEEAYRVLEVSQNEYVLAGWAGGLNGPPYDFCVVEISVELGGGGLFDQTFFVYTLVASAVALSLIFLVAKAHYKRKKLDSVDGTSPKTKDALHLCGSSTVRYHKRSHVLALGRLSK